jgi:hypothetical protein
MKLWHSIALFAAVLLGLLVLNLPLFDAPALPMDEGTLLVYPEQILKGRLPYRDFETFYGPGNIHALAGVYSIFGSSLPVERGVGLFYRLLIFAGVFMLGRRRSLACAVLCTAVAGLVSFVPSLTAFAWLGGVAALLWCLLLLAGPPQTWRAAVAGLLGAAALLYRQDLGLALILAAVPMWLLLPTRNRWVFLTGLGLGLTPYLVYAAIAGIRPLIDNLFVYPVLVTGPGRKLPLRFEYPGAGGIVLLHFIACAVNIFAAIRWVRAARKSVEARLFLAVSLLALGLSHQAMQRADVIHVNTSVFLSLALLPLSISVLAANANARVRGILVPATAVVVLALAAIAYPLSRSYFVQSLKIAFSSEASVPMDVEVRGRRFVYGSMASPLPGRLLKMLERDSKPGERLFVGGNDLRKAFATHTWMYYLAPWLEPATYFLEMNPFSANRPDSRLAADIKSADWLILDERWDKPNEPNLCAHNGSDLPNQVVREHFEQVTTCYTYALYRKKPAQVAH